MLRKNIYLVGPMGAGKSTIGKLLAKELEYEFNDSDHHIEELTGVTIPYIFEVEGEAGFRKREKSAIEHLCGKDTIVLATGGGVIMAPENRKNLKNNSIVIYLNVSPSMQYERIQFDNQRPLLQNENPEQVLEDLYNLRDPLYREVADYIIYSDNIPPKTVVSGIIESIIEEKMPYPEWLIGNRK